MADKTLRFQGGHIILDLPQRFAQSVGDRFETTPEDAILPSPAHRPLLEPLLPIRQITLPAHNVGRIEPADLVPGIEWLADSQVAVLPRWLA